MAKNRSNGCYYTFPVATVALFLMITLYFVTTSGFLDDTQFDDDPNEPALNVNGDMEVYLPDGSEVKELIEMVEADGQQTSWSFTSSRIKTTLPTRGFCKKLVT